MDMWSSLIKTEYILDIDQKRKIDKQIDWHMNE